MDREYWNYSTDHQPTHPYNLPNDLEQCHRSRRACVRDAKAFCEAEGIEYDDEMVAQVFPESANT